MTQETRDWLKEEQLICCCWWTDSAMHGSEAYSADDPNLGTIEGFSAGPLVRETDDYITLAMDHWNSGDYRHLQSISKRCVNKVKYINVVPKGAQSETV